MSILYNFLCRRHVLSIIEDVKDKKLTSINLSSFDMEMLPDQLFECKNLKKLYLQENKLECLDNKIIQLCNITTLTIDYNNLMNFPSEICQLINLQYLNISHNPLKKISQICNLSKLEVLWCNNIEMECLPDDIGALKELYTFGARGNKLRQLPNSFTQLVKLSWLTLENNLLNKLPCDIHKMRSLVHLNVKNNELKTLPLNLQKCKKMQYIFAGNNQISTMDLPDVLYISITKNLVYIDVRDNPFTKCTNFRDKLKKYPTVKVDDDWSPDLTEREEPNPTNETREGHSSESGETSPQTENEDTGSEMDADDSGTEYTETDSIASEGNWENSYPSSQLDSSDYDEEGEGENEILGVYLPELSRFIGTGS